MKQAKSYLAFIWPNLANCLCLYAGEIIVLGHDCDNAGPIDQSWDSGNSKLMGFIVCDVPLRRDQGETDCKLVIYS